MCTAYELGVRGGSFPERVKATAAAGLLGLRGVAVIRPTLMAPVLMPDGNLEEMAWGFRREFASKVKGRRPVARTIVNSREDKLRGRTWKDAFESRRCLIPAAGFFEWVVRGGKNVPLRFQDPEGRWLWIAGIWETSEKHGNCFSMVTTEPSAEIRPVHDRMPAVLEFERVAWWLDGGTEPLGASTVPLVWAETENFLKKSQ